MSRAALQGSTIPKMGLPRATAFRFGQGHSQAVFNVYFQAGETKNVRAKSTRWSVWQPCFRGCDMTLRAPPAASKVHRPQKPKRMTQTSMCCTRGAKIHISQPCFDHFFGPCFRGHDEAGLLAFSMSLFSDVGPLEAIAGTRQNSRQQSAASGC